MSVNSRFKAIQIIGQRKAFYRQRIPEPSCARKETLDIDILVTSRNGDRKTMNIYQSMNTYYSNTTTVIPTDKTFLHFHNELRVQERQPVNDQQSSISIFVDYLTISNSIQDHQPRHDSSISYIAVWQQPQDLRKKKLHGANQGSKFLQNPALYILVKISIQNHLKPSVTGKRRNEAKHLT